MVPSISPQPPNDTSPAPMTPDSVRTDALQPGDQIRHPHDWTLFTVSAAAEPLDDLGSPLDFHNRETDEFERGMRVTGTDVSGENVHVDTAPSYLWHREGRQATAPQDDVRAELTAEFAAWLVKKAREHRAQGPQYAKQADVIGRLADKASRGAVRPNNLMLLPAQGGPEDDVLAAQVAEHGPFPMPTGDLASALTGAAIEAKVYDSLVSFNSVACWDILRLAQMRQYLAEHVAADLAPELNRLRARVAELEAARHCASQMTTSLGTSQCSLPVRHNGDHRNAAGNHYWSDEYADAFRVRPPVPDSPEDSHERKVAEYLATPYTDDGPRPRQFTPMQVLARDVETAIAPLTGDAKAGAEMVLRYIRTLAAEATVPTVVATS